MIMNKVVFFFVALLVPVFAVRAQADQKLIDRANAGDTKAMRDLAFFYERGAGVPLDSAMALQWYQRAADNGDGDAWLAVSRYYLKGRFVAADTNRYFQIRKEWADKGLPNGIAGLGYAYLDGLGVETDTARFLELMEMAASKGSSWALGNLGDIYQYGRFGYGKNLKKAEQYYKKALKVPGTMTAQMDLAYFYAQTGDFAKAWSYSNEALKWNDPAAMDLQAELYFTGGGVPVDELKAQSVADKLVSLFPKLSAVYSTASRVYLYGAEHRDSVKGVEYLDKGIALGNATCMLRKVPLEIGATNYQNAFDLLNQILDGKNDDDDKGYAAGMIGEMYMQGLGVEQNDDSGIVWLKRAVEKYKNSASASSLAEYYANNGDVDSWGVNQQAVKYYETAVTLGDTDQLVELGRYYANLGNMEKAQVIFQRYVDYGRPDGYYWLALVAFQTDDVKKAISLLEQGDKKGSPVCRDVLGAVYEEGDAGLAVNYKKAEKYYLKSGSARAYNNLGRMYLSGKLGKQSEADIKKGMTYLEKAADMGFEDAIYSVGYCYESGNYVDSVDHVRAVSCFKRLADANIPSGLFKMGLYYELGDGGLEADSVKAIEYYRRAADLGHGEAMCYLGDFYRIGQFLPLDKERAFQYYLMADSAGEEIGTYYVARSYLEGCGVAIDTAAAIPFLKRAAEQGVGKASYLLAEFYNKAKGGLQENTDMATQYYLQAHRDGSDEASYYIAQSLLREDHVAEGVQYLATAVRRGNYDAAVLYALCMMEGVGLEKDPGQGYAMLEIVSKRVDNAAAYYHLGVARLNGEGCRQNETLGKKYLDTAAALGSLKAMTTLGICYLNGYGCNPDTATAIEWYRKAIEAGSLDACNRLGYLYEAMEEYEKAVDCYTKSVEGGNLEGYCCLGLCYEKGRGVILSHKKAFELYSKAAENGYGRGFVMLGYCYIDAINVEEDATTAFNWFLKGAEAGHVLGMFNVASMLEDGNGTKRDLKKAKYWYQQAAARGYEPAIEALKRF